MDCVPIVAITGQVATPLMGTDAFQEIDTFGIYANGGNNGTLADPLTKLIQIGGGANPNDVFGAQTHLLCFDETVYHHAVLKPAQCENALTSADFRRDGGTSFRDVLDEARKIDPSIVVILTDLDGAFGPPPPFDVVWATPRPSWPLPPFGKVLSLAR